MMTGKNTKGRTFKSKWFARWARRAGVENSDLCRAVINVEKGLIDADLGGGVLKQRVARQNEGKSGGYRTIILFRSGDKSFFVYGFAKSDRDNIEQGELEGFRLLAKEVFEYGEKEIARAIKNGAFVEVICNEKKVSK